MKKTVFYVALILTFCFLSVSAGALNVEDAFSFEEFVLEETILPYRIYVPEDYNEDNQYPLVVFLHGAGERGRDNDLQLKNAVQTLFDREDGLMMQSIVIAPQCPEGEQWVDTPWAEGNYSTDEIPESNELKAVVELVHSLTQKYSVDNSRIYAMGVSMGGFGTWDLIIRHNDIFAAAAPMCGGGDPSKAPLLIDTPIYTFHGTADNSVPFEGTEEMVNAIEDESGRKINFIVYEGEGHNIWEKASAEPDWVSWIFEQKLTDRYPEYDEPQDTTVTEPVENDTEPAETQSQPTTSKITDDESAPVSSEVDNGKESTTGFPTWIIVIIIAVIIAIGGALYASLAKRKK